MPVALAHLTPFFQRHQKAALLFCLLLWLAAALLGSRAEITSGLLPFFPDTHPEIRALAKAFDLQPFAHRLWIDFEIRNPDALNRDEREALLRAQARSVLEDIPPELASRMKAYDLPPFSLLLPLIPSLITEEKIAQLTALSQDEHLLKQHLSSWLDQLAVLPPGIPFAHALAEDPLHLLRLITDHLPKNSRISPHTQSGAILHPSGNHLLLPLYLSHSLHDLPSSQALLTALENATAKNEHPNIRTTVMGAVLHSAYNARAVEHDINTIALFSFLGFVLIYLCLVRSWGSFWLILLPFFAATCAFALLTFFFPKPSALALGFGASVLGLAEDYAVHSHFALRSDSPAFQVIRRLEPPLFQGFLVNAAGFLVLMTSSLPALRQLAFFSLLTITIGYVLAITLLPACPGFTTPPFSQNSVRAEPRVPAKKRLLIVLLVLLLLSQGLLARLSIDVSPRTLGAENTRLTEDAQYLRNIWGFSQEQVLVIEGENLEDALSKNARLATALRTRFPASNAFSVTDFRPPLTTARFRCAHWNRFLEDYGPLFIKQLKTAADDLGVSREALAKTITLLSTQATPKVPEVTTQGLLTQLTSEFIHTGTAPDTKTYVLMLCNAQFTLPQEFQDHVFTLGQNRLEELFYAECLKERLLAPAAWLLCLVVLVYSFRNIWQALLASLPPLCSLTCILIAFTLSAHPLTLTGLAALPLVLGLSADHGILVTHDLLRGRKTGVERAVLVSSLTTITGMGLLALATHPALRSMGEVIFWGLVCEIPVTLWLLPRATEIQRNQLQPVSSQDRP